VFASTWRAGSEAEIALLLGLCARSRRTVAALATHGRVHLRTQDPHEPADHRETAEPEDANDPLRPKAGLPRQPGSHPFVAKLGLSCQGRRTRFRAPLFGERWLADARISRLLER